MSTAETPERPRDISVRGGCPVCGGDMAVRIGPQGTRTCCTVCHWLSRAHVHRGEDGVHVIHPAGLLA